MARQTGHLFSCPDSNVSDRRSLLIDGQRLDVGRWRQRADAVGLRSASILIIVATDSHRLPPPGRLRHPHLFSCRTAKRNAFRVVKFRVFFE
jgi:hypothetical protein